MHALVKTYAEVRGLDLRDLFRSAHISAFGHDAGWHALDEDVAEFKRIGKTPPYVIRFFLNIVGVSHESESSTSAIAASDADPVQALRRAGL